MKKKTKEQPEQKESIAPVIISLLIGIVAIVSLVTLTHETRYESGQCFIHDYQPQQITEAYNSINNFTLTKIDLTETKVTKELLGILQEDKDCVLYRHYMTIYRLNMVLEEIRELKAKK